MKQITDLFSDLRKICKMKIPAKSAGIFYLFGLHRRAGVMDILLGICVQMSLMGALKSFMLGRFCLRSLVKVLKSHLLADSCKKVIDGGSQLSFAR